MGPFPKSHKFEYILVAVDYVAKWAEAQALPTNDTRFVVTFLKKLFCLFGMPKALINDRGNHFCNKIMEKTMKRYGVNLRFSTSYHPQTSGQAKNTNRALKRILEKTVKDNPAIWSRKLDDALWAFRTAYKTPTDNSKEWNSGDDQLRLRWMIYLVVLADAAESVRDAIGFEYCLASSSGWTKGTYDSDFGGYNEGILIGPELVLETTDKVVLIKEKLKAARDHQKSYVDFRLKPLESEVRDRVLLKVSPWKGVVRFGKKGKLAPRYVGPFEILKRIGLVAYRLRLPEELSSVHDTFHVSNLKKCLADANLHVSLNEIKIDKTLRFVEELVEIMDREIRNLKRSKIPLVKVHWNSKRGPEFTWEREDHMKSKYPQLFVDRAVESAS
ncbi:putative reverse transcriptase domain-containing protein [Tanacetum coccineum]